MRIRMWYQVVDSDEQEMSERLAAGGLDTTVPNVARIYAYYLGGKDNFAADRDAAERVLKAIPHAAEACQAEPRPPCPGRAVPGGRGHPPVPGYRLGAATRSNVHEIAQAVVPESRVPPTCRTGRC